jgi:hypothetical protein
MCGRSNGILYQRGSSIEGKFGGGAASGRERAARSRSKPCYRIGRWTSGELDGSRQRSFDHEGIRPSPGEHRRRTTIWRREVGAGNGKRSRVGADRSSGRPPAESEPIGDRGDKLITWIHSSGQIDGQTNRGRVSLLIAALFPTVSASPVPIAFPIPSSALTRGRSPPPNSLMR